MIQLAYHRERTRIDETSEERRLRYRLKIKLDRLGMTVEQYEAMLQAQGYRCAICRSDKAGGAVNDRYSWHVDHCHKTRRMRGLLCTHCNLALGRVRDSTELLRAMLAYLEKHE